jgi:hypothetical protein
VEHAGAALAVPLQESFESLKNAVNLILIRQQCLFRLRIPLKATSVSGSADHIPGGNRSGVGEKRRWHLMLQRLIGIVKAESVLSGAKEGAGKKGTFPEFRFLNSGSRAGLDHDASEVVVIGVDGKQIRRYKVAKAWRTGFLPATSGKRFGFYEHGYRALNSIINFLDIDGGRPQDFQRVRVIDALSGNEVSRLEWDPRPHLINQLFRQVAIASPA